MALTIRHRSLIDEGTKTVEPVGGESYDVSGDLEGPTGAAESTLVRETKAEEHLAEPTGAATKLGPETRTDEWVAESRSKSTEPKTTKTTTKTTAKKTSKKR